MALRHQPSKVDCPIVGIDRNFGHVADVIDACRYISTANAGRFAVRKAVDRVGIDHPQAHRYLHREPDTDRNPAPETARSDEYALQFGDGKSPAFLARDVIAEHQVDVTEANRQSQFLEETIELDPPPLP